jgi:hypothetical protein
MSTDPSAKREYGARLTGLTGPDREAFLLAESRLPGPRANLELLAVAVEEASPDELRRWAALAPDAAAPNTPGSRKRDDRFPGRPKEPRTRRLKPGATRNLSHWFSGRPKEPRTRRLKP